MRKKTVKITVCEIISSEDSLKIRKNNAYLQDFVEFHI